MLSGTRAPKEMHAGAPEELSVLKITMPKDETDSRQKGRGLGVPKFIAKTV